jgi:hypothetical protein
MPNKGYFLPDKTRHGIKESKDRFTALLCVSMQGEKIKPMIIGKSASPRSFPHKQLETIKYFYYKENENIVPPPSIPALPKKKLNKLFLQQTLKFQKREKEIVKVSKVNSKCDL